MSSGRRHIWLMLLSKNLGRRDAVLEKASPAHVSTSQSRPDSGQRRLVLVVLGFGFLRQDLGQYQPGLELLILLPLTPECWDRIYVQPHRTKDFLKGIPDSKTSEGQVEARRRTTPHGRALRGSQRDIRELCVTQGRMQKSIS